MLYLIVCFSAIGVFSIRICKAIDIDEACKLAGVSVDNVTFATLTQEELNALLIVDSGVVIKLV